MKRESSALPVTTWMIGLALATVAALLCASVADAQSMARQYERPTAPAGAAAGSSCLYVNSDDGLLNAGDAVAYAGDFSVAPGASVVLDDADGTLGTLISGENARITAGSGGAINITVTDAPRNVAGGNGVMNDSVCDSIVASTGISGISGLQGASGASGASGLLGVSGQMADSSAGGAALSVLPETGGAMLPVYLGLLAIAVGGLMLLRLHVRLSR